MSQTSLFDDADLPIPHEAPEPTREAGLARLEAFLPRAGIAYAKGRGHDRGPGKRRAVSALSPYLRHRLVTEDEVAGVALSQHGEAAEKFIAEVYWRRYFKGWLERRPWVWEKTRDETERALAALSGGRRKAYDRAVTGSTGIDGFDFWAEELVATGYLHNHARMWFASIWIFTLGLPWTLGADFFLRHLIDGDPASNTLSWRWVAGLHTSGKTYLATRENIMRFTDGRFAPQGLAAAAYPLSDDWNAEAGPVPQGGRPGAGVPSLLLLHEDDLYPERFLVAGLLAENDIVAIGGGVEAAPRSPLGTAPLPAAFVKGAMADALARAEAAFGAPASAAAGAEEILALARDAGARQIVTPFAPAGPGAAALARIEAAAGAAGIPMIRVLDESDAAAWPHCAKGFFGLKKKIPVLMGA